MEKVMQIINYVMKEILRHDSGNICSKQGLTKELVHLGYEKEDIDTAFHSLYAVPLFLNEKAVVEGEVSPIKHGQRILGEAEQRKLSIAFQSEIVRLMNSSLVSHEEIEQILFEAMQLDLAEVGLKELESIILRVIKDENRILLLLPHRSETMPCFLIQ